MASPLRCRGSNSVTKLVSTSIIDIKKVYKENTVFDDVDSPDNHFIRVDFPAKVESPDKEETQYVLLIEQFINKIILID